MAILTLTNANVAQQTLHGLGADLDVLHIFGETALMCASGMGNVESVKLLHAMKADVNICGRFGTAMHSAAYGGHTEMFQVTLS